MNTVLMDLQDEEMFVYVDDVVLFAKGLSEHGKHFRRLFDRLRAANLSVQPDKCMFLAREVEYLGHVITKDGILPDPKKISAIKQYPRPQNVKQERQFLGLSGFYRRYIKDYTLKAEPLISLTKKNTSFD